MKSPILAGGNKKNAGSLDNFYSFSNSILYIILYMTTDEMAEWISALPLQTLTEELKEDINLLLENLDGVGNGGLDDKIMTIEVTRKDVYGKTLTYVTDESVRNSIKKLTGRKTLTDYDIEALKELGFVLVIKQMTVNI